MRLLDLCSGAGAAAEGYARAGFDVHCVDIAPQPWNPHSFEQGDALTYPLDGFDVVHASPPCQRWSAATPVACREDWPDLLSPLRDRLRRSGLPYVIENVPGAPLDAPVWLCGSAFGLGVRRHRGFESNVPLAGTQCCHVGDIAHVYGSEPPEGVAAARAAMGVDWMPWDNLREAIPPDYTEFLGRQLRRFLECQSSAPLGASVAAPGGLRRVDVGVASFAPARSVASTIANRRCRCGRGLPLPKATGRWPKYCSKSCRQTAWREARRG